VDGIAKTPGSTPKKVANGIKKAATLFGVALDLRDEDDVIPTKPYVQQNQRTVSYQ
jgi:hypothetical protein